VFVTIRLIILAFCVFVCLAEASEKTTRDSLSSVSQKLHRWQTYLLDHEKQQQQLQTQLKVEESAVAKVEVESQHLNRQVAQQQQLLKRLTQEQYAMEARIHEEHRLLEQQVRSTFLLSQTSPLKLLLNINDVNRVGRHLMLYRILLQKRSSMLMDLEANLARLEKTRSDVIKTEHDLKKLYRKAVQAQQDLSYQQQKRLKTMQQLHQAIQTGHAKVSQLRREKQSLERVIAELQRRESLARSQSVKPSFIPQGSLASVKQQLEWPVHGLIQHRFGQSMAASDMTWHGIVIQAPEGNPIQAIFPGKVIFANWLQGFGFTLIIDHGNGYMSLYARNQGLNKKEGDSVSHREVIAHVGKSGGFSESSLYFELRHHGKPLNPLDWLKKN
jgi:murein hydrolase activator